jgi:hypothetical protein
MLKTDILEYLKNKHLSSNGANGTYIPILQLEFGLEYWILKPILIDLHKEKLIIIKEGINGKMIYYNKK